MTWLDNKVKSTELANGIAENVVEGITSSSNRFFEFDDDTTGVDIDGYLFFPREVQGDESFSHREFQRTKIMSGGEFVSRGQYIPREYSFETIIDINPDELDEYLKIFGLMENRVCRVTSPYMGGMFKAEVMIDVTNPETSPHVIECKVTIKEIPSVMARLNGDPIIQYPSISTVSDVSVTERKNEEKPKTNGLESTDYYDSYTSSTSINM